MGLESRIPHKIVNLAFYDLLDDFQLTIFGGFDFVKLFNQYFV